MDWGLVGDVVGVRGWWLGLEKPGFYGGLGLVVSVWGKNPVSGWVVGSIICLIEE
ncbi:hypothetical protein QUB60_27200 [Microcoleus sp. A2-C5]|uniref:hypothetical protein n=1 Tax=unclassified Microcoleus TaxID=2642155 RepID=UPI002FD5AFAE